MNVPKEFIEELVALVEDVKATHRTGYDAHLWAKIVEGEKMTAKRLEKILKKWIKT